MNFRVCCLQRELLAIKQWHRYQHFPDPTEAPIVSKTLTGIARIHGKPKDKAPPLLPEHLVRIAAYLAAQSGIAAIRDSALLQIGFLGAFRRSELVAIKMENIDWRPDGIEILITRSKTDQINAGQHCFIPNGNEQLCAVRALKIWLEKASIKEGVYFGRIEQQIRRHSNGEFGFIRTRNSVLSERTTVHHGIIC